MIVKSTWLPFLVPLAPLLELQSLILKGQISSVDDIPAHLFGILSEEQRLYVWEKSLQVSGRPVEILASLSPPAPSSPKQGDILLWQERMFLRGFAYSRLGNELQASLCFSLLPKRFQLLTQIERVLAHLNNGRFTECLEESQRILSNDLVPLDPYSGCSFLGAFCLALLHLGDFKEAKKMIRKREEILEENPSPSLIIGTRLYEISLRIEEDNFFQAEKLLKSSFAQWGKESVNGFFLSHLKLKFHLARNELDIVKEELLSLKQALAKAKFPEGVLDLRMDELELLLRMGDLSGTRQFLDSLKRSNEKSQNHFLEFRLLRMESRWLFLCGKVVDAIECMQRAISIGEARGYRPGLTWALFDAAGMAISSGSNIKAQIFLQRGIRLAKELNLSTRASGYEYILDLLERKYDAFTSLIALAKSQQMGPELEYIFDSYKLVEDNYFEVRDKESTEKVSEHDLRRRLLREKGFFWFQKEAVLFWSDGNGNSDFLTFAKGSNELALFKLFWHGMQERNLGLSLESVHKVKNNVPYKSYLHESAVKVFLSRFRDRLRKAGLRVQYNRNNRHYFLLADAPTFSIRTYAREKVKRDREQMLLDRISMESFVSTVDLCGEFQVSRQALHPILKQLCQKKRLKLVRKGPISGYIFLK